MTGVSKWLNDAAPLSGDNGPIQRMTYKDILEWKPEWDRRETETWNMLGRGEIPIFIAAQIPQQNTYRFDAFPCPN